MKKVIISKEDGKFKVIQENKFTKGFDFFNPMDVIMDDFDSYQEAEKWCHKFNYEVVKNLKLEKKVYR